MNEEYLPVFKSLWQDLISSKAASMDTTQYGPLGSILISCADVTTGLAQSSQEINKNIYCGWKQVRDILETKCNLVSQIPVIYIKHYLPRSYYKKKVHDVQFQNDPLHVLIIL